jgi:hypothetical protein
MAEDEDALGEGIKENGVGAALNVNGLYRLQCLCVEHGNRLAAGEAVARLRIDDDTIRRRIRNFADGLERVQIENGDSAGVLAWNI